MRHSILYSKVRQRGGGRERARGGGPRRGVMIQCHWRMQRRALRCTCVKGAGGPGKPGAKSAGSAGAGVPAKAGGAGTEKGGGGGAGLYREEEDARRSCLLGGVAPRAMARPAAAAMSSISPIEDIDEDEAPGTSYRVARARQRVAANGRPRLDARPRRAVKRMKIAIDVDDVLASYLPVVNAYYNERFSTSFRTSDYFVYDYKQIWGCTQQESNERVHEFYGSHAFLNTVQPIPGAVASVARLCAQHDLFIVTSRQLVIEEATRTWLERHFPPGTFLSVNFGNAYALTGPQRSKAEICLELGCDVLIDDNPKYTAECAAEGIDTLLFDHNLQYAWSKPTSPGARDAGDEARVTRVADWDEVEAWVWEACTTTNDRSDAGTDYRIMG